MKAATGKNDVSQAKLALTFAIDESYVRKGLKQDECKKLQEAKSTRAPCGERTEVEKVLQKIGLNCPEPLPECASCY